MSDEDGAVRVAPGDVNLPSPVLDLKPRYVQMLLDEGFGTDGRLGTDGRPQGHADSQDAMAHDADAARRQGLPQSRRGPPAYRRRRLHLARDRVRLRLAGGDSRDE